MGCTTQNLPDHHLRAMATWEHALDFLDPADIKLKDEYENELEGARKLRISAVEFKAISNQPIGDDSPSDRVLRMPYVEQKLPLELAMQLSSVCSYIHFCTNLDLFPRLHDCLLHIKYIPNSYVWVSLSWLSLVDFSNRDTFNEPKEGGVACIRHAQCQSISRILRSRLTAILSLWDSLQTVSY